MVLMSRTMRFASLILSSVQKPRGLLIGGLQSREACYPARRAGCARESCGHLIFTFAAIQANREDASVSISNTHRIHTVHGCQTPILCPLVPSVYGFVCRVVSNLLNVTFAATYKIVIFIHQ